MKQLSEEKQKSKCLKRQISELEKVNQKQETNYAKNETQYFDILSKMKYSNEEMSRLLIESQECASDIMEQYSKLKLEYEKHQIELDTVQKKLDKCKSNSTVTLKKKMKYRDSSLHDKKKEIKTLKETQKSLQDQLDAAHDQLDKKSSSLDSAKLEVETLKHQKRQYQYKVAYFKRRINELAGENVESAFLDEISDLQKKIIILNRENKDLQELICLLQDKEVATFQDGRYCDDIRETIMELLNMNVSMNKVNDVIKLVLKRLAGKEVERLPSNAVKSRLLVEARHLAYVQVVKAMSDGGESGNCLHGDDTTKYHRHYQSFQITTSSGNTLSFGLQEMAGQDAAALLNTFTSAVDELTEVISSTDAGDKERVFSELVLSIRSTMSDQCAVNPCFNEQLKQLRERLLPLCIENWSSLSKSSQDELKNMCNFFCKLHLLANFATECDKILKMLDVACEDDNKTKHVFITNESGAVRLIRTACKAFHPRGSDEAGVSDYFQVLSSRKREKTATNVIYWQ